MKYVLRPKLDFLLVLATGICLFCGFLTGRNNLTSPKRFSRRTLKVEGLQPRLAMAGDIRSALAGGTLTLRGDGNDNSVQVDLVGDKVLVTGSSTRIVGKAEFAASQVKSLSIGMFGGDDDVRLNNMLVDKAVVDLGENFDSLTVNALVATSLEVRGGGGDDTIAVNNSTISGTVTIGLGEGNNIFNSAASKVGSLSVASGTGNDRVSLSSFSADRIRVATEAGRDTVELSNVSGASTEKVASVSITTSADQDRVSLISVSATNLMVRGGRQRNTFIDISNQIDHRDVKGFG